MSRGNIPNSVEQGWVHADVVNADPAYRLLHYEDGTIRFEHTCKRRSITIICAPALQLSDKKKKRHYIVQKSPITIAPSILCPDCGTHGFVRNGKWTDAGTPR